MQCPVGGAHIRTSRSLVHPWFPRRFPRDVRGHGKKRTKRRIVPLKPQDADSYEGSPAEYLKFGAILGYSPEESLETIQERRASNELPGRKNDEFTLDSETQQMFNELERKEQERIQEKQKMRKIVKGDLDWHKMRQEVQDRNQSKPIWTKASNYVQPERNLEGLFVDQTEEDDDEGEDSAYGRFLLENDEDVPEDFTYEDFEAMIAGLPENMVQENEGKGRMDLVKPNMTKSDSEKVRKGLKPKLAPRPRSKFHNDDDDIAQTSKSKPGKVEKSVLKKVPKLKAPKMKSTLFPKHEV
eukprot:g5692.t1